MVAHGDKKVVELNDEKEVETGLEWLLVAQNYCDHCVTYWYVMSVTAKGYSVL